MSKKKPIDKTKFEELVDMGKSKKEICAVFSISEETLSRWCQNNYQCNFSEMANTRIGRPHKVIDKLQFEDLCNIYCTEEEILQVLRVSDKTLNEWCKRTYNVSFSDVYRIYASSGAKVSLRRWQLEQAKTNPQMAIWLGKQILGQRDVVEQEIKAVVNDTHSQIIDKLSQRVKLEDDNGISDNN